MSKVIRLSVWLCALALSLVFGASVSVVGQNAAKPEKNENKKDSEKKKPPKKRSFSRCDADVPEDFIVILADHDQTKLARPGEKVNDLLAFGVGDMTAADLKDLKPVDFLLLSGTEAKVAYEKDYSGQLSKFEEVKSHPFFAVVATGTGNLNGQVVPMCLYLMVTKELDKIITLFGIGANEIQPLAERVSKSLVMTNNIITSVYSTKLPKGYAEVGENPPTWALACEGGAKMVTVRVTNLEPGQNPAETLKKFATKAREGTLEQLKTSMTNVSLSECKSVKHAKLGAAQECTGTCEMLDRKLKIRSLMALHKGRVVNCFVIWPATEKGDPLEDFLANWKWTEPVLAEEDNKKTQNPVKPEELPEE